MKYVPDVNKGKNIILLVVRAAPRIAHNGNITDRQLDMTACLNKFWSGGLRYA